jgi:general secretion pathway protein D
MPGSAFQVLVHNPGAQPLSTSLMVDGSVLSIEAPGGESGRVALTVPPRASAPVMLRARKDVSLADTEVTLDSGGQPLRLRVRDPAAPDPGEAPEGGAPPDAPAPGDAGAQPER